MKKAIKGQILSAERMDKIRVIENGYLVYEDGIITDVTDTLDDPDIEVKDYGNRLIVQAMSDMHLHAPQEPMVGLGLNLPLIEWLNTYTFPTEANFKDPAFAEKAFNKLCDELLASGVTRVAIFSSMHREATELLMKIMEKKGLSGLVGKVNMDRNGGENLEETTEESIRETEKWLSDTLGKYEHITPVITPRFTPSCTNELMEYLGKTAKEHGLYVQSHLSENQNEIAWVHELHPDTTQYWESYDKYGLFGDHTLMGHCVWSDERERKAMRDRGVYVVHCPTSNTNLMSGIAPVRQMLTEGNKVLLGSDIGAGSDISGFEVVRDAIQASKNRKILDDFKTEPLSVEEAWYLATSAPQEYFGEKPGFSPGNELHAVVINDDQMNDPWTLTPVERLERAIYRRQPGAVEAVHVRDFVPVRA